MEHVVVMGGSSGIGEATAEMFSNRGARVTITGRDPEKLDRVARRIGEKTTGFVVDASVPAEVTTFFADLPAIDHLVLALSGAAGGGPFASLDLDDLQTGFAGKFWPHLRTLQAALPKLRDTGSVVFVTASSARAALSGTAGLAAINGALEAMVGPLATELAPLRVNAVSPGVIDTPWWNWVPAEQRKEAFASFAEVLPVGRVGRPEDVAQAILLLATNPFMTGTVLEVTGGAHLATGR